MAKKLSATKQQQQYIDIHNRTIVCIQHLKNAKQLLQKLYKPTAKLAGEGRPGATAFFDLNENDVVFLDQLQLMIDCLTEVKKVGKLRKSEIL